MLLIEEPIQEYTFPVLERNIIHEDAFDEIEILLVFRLSSPLFEAS